MTDKQDELLTPEKALRAYNKDEEKYHRIDWGRVKKILEAQREMTLGEVAGLINTKEDLVHTGYHGYASKTLNPKCKGCQIEQALKQF